MWGLSARLAVPALAAVTLVVAPLASAAQSWSLDTDATYASRYEWRGLVRDPGGNLQQAVYLSAFPGRAILTAGLWWVTDLSEDDGGLPRGWGRNRRPWVEGSYGSDAGFVFVGVTGHHVEGTVSGAATPDTWEAYVGGAGMLPRVPLQVEGTLFWDVHRVRGGYLETAAALQIPLWTGVLVPIGSLFLEGRVGTSLGQESSDANPASRFYFDQGGVTHLDASLRTTSTPVVFAGVEGSLTLEARWTRGFDPATRHGPGGVGDFDRDRWGWHAGVRLTAPACRPTRELCEDL